MNRMLSRIPSLPVNCSSATRTSIHLWGFQFLHHCKVPVLTQTDCNANTCSQEEGHCMAHAVSPKQYFMWPQEISAAGQSVSYQLVLTRRVPECSGRWRQNENRQNWMGRRWNNMCTSVHVLPLQERSTQIVIDSSVLLLQHNFSLDFKGF